MCSERVWLRSHSLAAQKGCADMLKHLLDSEVDVNAKTVFKGSMVAHGEFT
jgi:hypothetical protein